MLTRQTYEPKPINFRHADPIIILLILTFKSALDERVAVVSLVALADGVVVADAALGVHTAGAGTRVRAPRVHASLVRGTIVAQQAFGSASNCGVSLRK